MIHKGKCSKPLAAFAFAGMALVSASCATGSAGGADTLDSTGSETAAVETGRGGGLPSDCFFNNTVRDFTTLDNRNLIIHGAGRRAYHVVLASPSFDIEHEYRIGIYDRDGRVCPYGGDAIIVQGAITERISIRSIEAIDETQLENLLVRFGKQEAASEDLVTVTDVE